MDGVDDEERGISLVEKKRGSISLGFGIIIVLGCLGGVCLAGSVVQYWWNGLYDAETFNCVKMSYVLAPICRVFGFDTKIVYGVNDALHEGHCWLSLNGVYVDSTTLWFNGEEGYRVFSIEEEI